MFQPCGADVRDGCGIRRAGESKRDGGVTEVEPRQNGLHHQVEATCLFAQA
jgi:hypothetical protein